MRQCGRVANKPGRFADPLPAAPSAKRGERQSASAANRKALVLDALSAKFRALAAARGIETNPAFAGAYDFASATGADFAQLFPGFLKELPAGGVVMCHPGLVDAELERLDPLTTMREREYEYLADDAFPGVLRAHGVALAWRI